MGNGVNAATLLEQGRYADVLGLIGRPADDGQQAATEPATLVVAVRCRLEQGYVRAALDLARAVSPAVPGAGDAGIALRLWAGFLPLYDAGDRPFAERAAEFASLRESLSAAAGPAVAALAGDLRARTDVLRFVLSGLGPEHRGPLVTGLAAAAGAYRAAGQSRDAIAALVRAASFAVDGLPAHRELARGLLAQARDEAAAACLPIPRANAELALAELDLQAVLDGHADGDGLDTQAVLSRFAEIAAGYRAAGHAYGDALAQWPVARLLLKYGIDAGLGMANEAVAGFAAADAASAQLQALSALTLWHTIHGDPAQARQAAARAAELTSALGFAQATEVRELDEANQAFRSGNVALARELLARGARSSPGMQAASRLMLATSANAVGLRAQARQLLDGVVDDLTRAGASLMLGEALALLANLLTGEDDARARELLHAAADVARAAQSPVEEAKYRGQLAWTLITQRMRAGEPACRSAESDSEFAVAERLLAGQRTLEAGAELARLQQLRGQAAFFDKDWDQVGDWLTRAEATASALGLRPDLAFILCYQGLAMIEVARRTGPATYDQAARLLASSRELFRQVDLPAFAWQAGFYQALCDIEAARARQPAAEEAARLERAATLMEEASGLVDQLRLSADRGAVSERQAARMAFSVDKQVFYREGFRLAWDARADARAAWRWLERMKGRALLDSLADGPGNGGHRAAALRSVPPDYAQVRALLAAEEAAQEAADGAVAGKRRIIIAEFFCTPERTLAFGARADWDAPQVAYVRHDYAALRAFATLTFRHPGGFRMLMEDLGEDGLRQWHRFAPLLEPVADWAAPDDVVYLVPHGLLHDLPLHTLPVGQAGRASHGSPSSRQPLLDRNPVCYVPAAAVLRHALRGSAPAGPATAAVFGDSRGDLRSAREEAAQVAALLGVTPVTGADVTRARLKHALATAGVVHVAGHGELSTADGFASGLDLAGADVLRAGDLLGQPCATRLAVLSGCDTGVSELRPGDEAVGLIRALLLSGVRSILASQWRVNDQSTRELVCRFHQAAAVPGVSLADALRQAARSVRDDTGHGHPYHWGAFALFGSWR